MSKYKFLFSIVFSLSNLYILAQESDPWTAYMMPGENHKILSKYTGDFKLEITMWMMEGADSVVMKVQSSNRMILGNRFLEMTQTGDMMGMPYHAISTLGYNNSDKNFNLSTITNMGTGTLYLSGYHDNGLNTVQLKGNLSNPVNGNLIEVRQVLHFIDEDNLLIENFDKEAGSIEGRSITYKFTRIKK